MSMEWKHINFTDKISDLCAPYPVPEAIKALNIDITDYPIIMKEADDAYEGTDWNMDKCSKISGKCHVYAEYMCTVVTKISNCMSHLERQAENLEKDLKSNVNGICPTAAAQTSEAAKERVASLNPQLRSIQIDAEIAKNLYNHFNNWYVGLVRGSYFYKSKAEEKGEQLRSQPKTELPEI